MTKAKEEGREEIIDRVENPGFSRNPRSLGDIFGSDKRGGRKAGALHRSLAGYSGVDRLDLAQAENELRNYPDKIADAEIVYLQTVRRDATRILEVLRHRAFMIPSQLVAIGVSSSDNHLFDQESISKIDFHDSNPFPLGEVDRPSIIMRDSSGVLVNIGYSEKLKSYSQEEQTNIINLRREVSGWVANLSQDVLDQLLGPGHWSMFITKEGLIVCDAGANIIRGEDLPLAEELVEAYPYI